MLLSNNNEILETRKIDADIARGSVQKLLYR